MKTFTTKATINDYIRSLRNKGKTIGFVPTMGALHKGHLSLMERAKAENDFLVVSVFVNPLQFNNPKDLISYPRSLNTDKELLQSVGCDMLFAPSQEEMYPASVDEKYDFGLLETVMEGTFRPGHFNGVAIVVKRLFEIVMPHRAYFGEKDYQQLSIIKKLVEKENLPVKVIPCPIIRESSGLAMSSRNERLSPKQRKEAAFIYKTLQIAKRRKNDICPLPLKQMIINIFNANKNFKLEYFEIVDDKTLQPITAWGQSQGIMAFVAVWINNVRLIDNIRII